MITQFAVKILNMKPDTALTCSFPDIQNETAEMRFYIKIACQLGLMGFKSDGKSLKEKFNPNNIVTRNQFGTVLSRVLYD